MLRRRIGAVAVVVGLAACHHANRPAAGDAARDSLFAAGESLYAHEKYDSARAVWGAVVARARTAQDERSQARALTSIALADYRLGDLNKSRRDGEEALAIKRRLGPTAEFFASYNTLGLVALSQGRYQEAVDLFNQAAAAASAGHDTVGLARASGNLGLAYTNLGDLRRARDAQRQARALAHARGKVQLEANALVNEAMVDIWESDPRPAIARLDTARLLYHKLGYATGDHIALSQLATAFELTGDYGSAFAALDTALAIARRVGASDREAEDLRLLAGLHLLVGDYRRSAAYFDEAASRMRSAGYEAERANALLGAAEAHLRLGNLTRARSSAEQALRFSTKAGARLDQLDDFLLLAEIDFRTAGLARAEPRLRAARALAERLRTRGARIAVALKEAHLADLAGDARRVQRTLAGAAPDMAAGDYGAEWEADALASRAYARLGSLDSAAAAGRRAVAAVERLRGELASEALRTTFVADRADVYGDLVLVLLRLRRTEEAFAVADEARSRELLRQLSATRGRVRSNGFPRDLLDGDELLWRIDTLVQKLRESEPGRHRERGETADSADAALAAQLETERARYEALLIRVAQEQPRSAALLGTATPRLDQIRAALQPDEVLLDYLLTRNRVLVFALTRQGLKVVQAGLETQALTQRIQLLRDLWGSHRADWKRGLPAARALYQVLVAPVRNAGILVTARELIVVPHGIVGQVPFAALVDERTGRYLIQDFSIASLPSASALPALRRGPDVAGAWAGAAEGLAPFPDELPATRQEVVAFHASVPQATVLLGPEATEREMRSSLIRDDLVHVATHGVLNVHNPMFSRIELARPAAVVSEDDDGRLEVHELLGLSIRSPLVFLSGCETGAGQEWTDDPVRGAAELTLAQAFLFAGATNVVLTLWRIDDTGAAAFAGRFYEHMSRLSVAGALAAAQQDMAGDARYASPYYWAGYVLSGAGRLSGSAHGFEGAPSYR